MIQLKDEKLISEYPIAEAFAVMTYLCLSSHMEMGFKKSITETDSMLSNHSVTAWGRHYLLLVTQQTQLTQISQDFVGKSRLFVG